MKKRANENFDELGREKLVKLVSQLTDEYEDAISYMKDQVQALIDNDLKQLEKKVQLQVSKYQEIQVLERRFKTGLNDVCESESLDQNEYSLTGLLKQNSNRPLEEVRNKLLAQIKETKRLENQLSELLEFAKTHNHESIQVLNRLKNQLSVQYDKEGEKKENTLRSISINKKV